MKMLRHAAALALVGWYLMVPAQVPQSGAANADGLTTASIWGSYDTKAQCEADRAKFLSDPVVGAKMSAASCMESAADPRLKPK